LQDNEIRDRLYGAVDREGMGPERARIARYIVDRILPEVKKLIREEVQAEKQKSKPKEVS